MERGGFNSPRFSAKEFNMLSIASGVTAKASLDYQDLMARRLIYLLIILSVLIVAALFDVLIG
ncbi:MAG: hypothetical protein DRQ59_13125, partial [Gammaproteobacteria bacterium]